MCPNVGEPAGALPSLCEPLTHTSVPCEEAVIQLRQRTNLSLVFFFFKTKTMARAGMLIGMLTPDNR